MKLSRRRLLMEAAATGFRPEVLEKCIRLLSLLENLQRHPALEGKLALKGGTALNLFLFDLPRLSVDIDLNYIGRLDKGEMLADRTGVEEAVRAVCLRDDMMIADEPSAHAGGKWLLRYESALGYQGNLEVDLNFMFRRPLWPVSHRDSRRLGSYIAMGIPVLDVHELAAGQLVALLDRGAARDLFDSHLVLEKASLDTRRLRVAFVVYCAMIRRDLRGVTAERVHYDPVDLQNRLIPMLRSDFIGRLADPLGWAERLVEECRERLAAVLPFSVGELEFLGELLERGRIFPSLITSDPDLAQAIAEQPMLAWKAGNVRRYRGR